MKNIAEAMTVNGISIDGVHGIRTWDRRLEAIDTSTELWRPTNFTMENFSFGSYLEKI